jgi:hypothetical protein
VPTSSSKVHKIAEVLGGLWGRWEIPSCHENNLRGVSSICCGHPCCLLCVHKHVTTSYDHDQVTTTQVVSYDHGTTFKVVTDDHVTTSKVVRYDHVTTPKVVRYDHVTTPKVVRDDHVTTAKVVSYDHWTTVCRPLKK